MYSDEEMCQVVVNKSDERRKRREAFVSIYRVTNGVSSLPHSHPPNTARVHSPTQKLVVAAAAINVLYTIVCFKARHQREPEKDPIVDAA